MSNRGDIPVHIDPKQVHETLKRHMHIDGYDIVLDLDKSHNGYLHDSRTGKRYLDMFTFFASNPLAMNHPRLNNQEFIQKIGHIALHKPSCSDIYSVAMAEFVETFFRVAVPDDFVHSFYIEGGALAVENTLKTAFDWKVRKNFAKGHKSEKGFKVMHFEHAFHGRSGYTLSLTNTDPVKTMYFPKFTDWPRMESPFATYPLEGSNLERTVEAEQRVVAAIEATFAQHPDEIACVILEPIQGEGGDNHFRPEFLAELRRICDENEALLIFDEVQTGMGITGTMWAFEGLGVRPDMISFGKKTQVCGLLATNRVDDVKDNVFEVSSRINSTWGGNLVDMVRFTRYLEVIEEENLVENARTVGEYLLNGIAELCGEFPELLSNARGRGLMCAFDVANHPSRVEFRKQCFNNGMMILGAGDRTIRFRPPLTIERSHVDEAMDVMRKSARTVIEAHVPAEVDEADVPPTET
jgi:L-lysine 6-transaminase